MPTAASPHQRLGVRTPVRVVRRSHGPLHAHVPHDAEPAGVHGEVSVPAVPAHVIRDAELDSGVATGRGHPFGVRRGGRHRLLAEHVLARSRRRDALLGVQAVRRCEQHRVEIGVGEQSVEVGVCRFGGRRAVALGEVARASRVAAQHAPQLRTRCVVHRWCKRVVGDPAGRDHRDTKGSGRVVRHHGLVRVSGSMFDVGPWVSGGAPG